MKTQINGKIAIYSRKSKFTGKGESIGNQIEECKKHIAYKYQITDMNQIVVYEDEGFSGKNTKRPQFQQMLGACRNHEISMIVCYRLDRISRNTIDFALLYQELERLDINFISVTENFDTTTPLGRAMLSISSAFAQLERDTIAERIRDNMLALAKTGRWLGGTTPLGYISTAKTSVDIEGKIRTAYRLKTDSDNFSLTRLIFDKFLEFRSLTKVETYLLNYHYKTRNGKNFSRTGIRDILKNPVYAAADEDTLCYFNEIGTLVFNESSEFNGTHGLMVYNKSNQASEIPHKQHNYSEWIVAIGKHKPLLTGKEWLQVQELLEQNKSKSYRKPKDNTALLSGILICADCGSYMRPKANRSLDENGNKRFSYLCETKEKSHGQLCSMNRPDGNLLDKMVCDKIKEIARGEDVDKFHEQLKYAKKQLLSKEVSKTTELDHLQKVLHDTDRKIENLVLALSEADNTPAFSHINKQINNLHEEKMKIEKQIHTLNELLQNQNILLANFDVLIEKLSSFSDSFDMMSIEEKRTTLRILVDKVVWDGTHVHLCLVGQNNEKTKPQRAGCKRDSHASSGKKEIFQRNLPV